MKTAVCSHGGARAVSIAFLLFAALVSPAAGRTMQNINQNWKFNYGDVTGAQATTFVDAAWSTVSLPHTFRYTNYHEALPRGIGWYRRHFSLLATDSTKKIFLEFGGAMTVAQVWVNGGTTPLPCTQSNYGAADTTHYGGAGTCPLPSILPAR
jgi:hypothetical protein